MSKKRNDAGIVRENERKGNQSIVLLCYRNEGVQHGEAGNHAGGRKSHDVQEM